MYCNKCGTELSDDSKFCHNCGASVRSTAYDDPLGPSVFDPVTPPPVQQTYTPPPTYNNAPDERNEGIYGLLGFILAFFVPIVGLVLSIMGLNRKKNRGLAVAGLVISIVSMVVYVIIVAAVSATYSSDYPYSYPYAYYLVSMI